MIGFGWFVFATLIIALIGNVIDMLTKGTTKVRVIATISLVLNTLIAIWVVNVVHSLAICQ